MVSKSACLLIPRDYIRAGSHGVPSPTYVSKSQHGGKVPTFEPQETIKIKLIIIKLWSWLVNAKTHSRDLCWELGLAFCSTQLSTHVPSLTSQSVAVWGSMSYLGLKTWDPMWSGKSQFPCSQQLRLHGLTSRDLGLRTWDHVWTCPKSSQLRSLLSVE